MPEECNSCMCKNDMISGLAKEIREVFDKGLDAGGGDDEYRKAMKEHELQLTMGKIHGYVQNAIRMARECGWHPNPRSLEKMEMAYKEDNPYKFLDYAASTLGSLGPDCSEMEMELYEKLFG